MRTADAIWRKDRDLDPESRRIAAILDLALGDVDSSVRGLERAAAEAPGNPEILSDLAAAYLVRASAADRPIDLAAALDTAERAVELSPKSPEALYNRALARQRLSLAGEAVKAWRGYIASETDPEWAQEGRRALQKLQSPSPADLWPVAKAQLQAAARRRDQRAVTEIVDRFRQEAREYGENESLLSWADHQGLGDRTAADQELAIARAIGRSLVRLSGESMLADTVADIDRALQHEPERSRVLLRGFAAYRQGFLLVKERKFDEAAAPFEEASRALRRAGSPFAGWADFLLVRCAYQAQQFGEAQRRAFDLLDGLDAGRYPTLAGRARWVLGMAQLALARPAEALESLQLALPQFQRTREARNEASVHTRLGSIFEELGDFRSSWQERLLALRGLLENPDPKEIRLALIDLAFGSVDAGYARTALLAQSEAVDIARAQGDPEQLAGSLVNRAAILARTGLTVPEDDLAEAARSCELIQDPSIRESIQADLFATEGRVTRSTDPARALASLDRALELYRTRDRRLQLAPTLHSRAVALRRLGRDAEAERDLESAIEVLEEERGSVQEAEQRANFIERTSAVFDSMIFLQVDHQRPETALDYSERRRARLLLDWLSALPEETDAKALRLDTWTHPRPVGELRQSLPAGVAVLAYEILPDRLLLWVVRRDAMHLRQVRIAAARLEARVRRFKESTDGPEEGLRQASVALHQLLIAPVADLLHAGETVVFIPESPLGSIPFGLLYDARRGRYLIEDRPFAVAPSLSTFVELSRMAGPPDFSRADLLVLADPAFDRSLHPDLGRLAGALEEGRTIQSLFPPARVEQGERAGREVLLEGLGRYRVLHFGGHALANTVKPLLSSLLLARGEEQGDTGVLYARDIVGPSGGATDLVVLSTCRSGGGATPPGEGVAGLVWPFFSRGVSTVVASTREVNDRRTASLFATFYRHLAAGVSPVEALRDAQLAALAANRRAPRPSFDWAVFQIYGAVPGSETAQKGAER